MEGCLDLVEPIPARGGKQVGFRVPELVLVSGREESSKGGSEVLQRLQRLIDKCAAPWSLRLPFAYFAAFGTACTEKP